jgi:non-heme chloroperoxidase
MPTFQTTDGEIFYEDQGSGRPVVFIHGLWLTSRFFARQRAFFAERYRFIAPDLRSHGRSENLLHDNTVPGQARDLHELFLALDLHEIVLVGWSSGAFCAWQYLQDYGSNDIAGIVIVDESPTDFNWSDWTLGAVDLPGLIAMVEEVQTNHAALVRGGFVRNLFATKVSDDELDWMVAEITMIPPTIAAAVAFDGATRDYRPMLADIDVPTLVCFGSADQVLSPDNGPYLAAAIPGARLVMFERSGHGPFWDEPDLFNTELDRFIASLGGP